MEKHDWFLSVVIGVLDTAPPERFRDAVLGVREISDEYVAEAVTPERRALTKAWLKREIENHCNRCRS